VIGRIHHVGVLVRDLDAGLGFWRDTLGLPLLRSADLPEQGVRAALLACGAGEVELLAPMTTDSGVSRFLANRGESVHHVCFESDDVVKDVLRFIGNRREWLANYEVKRALLFNPKTPIGISMKFLGHMRASDLRSLAQSRNVTANLRQAAQQRISQRGGKS